MENLTSYEAILEAAQNAGIKDTKLEKAVTTSYLPEGENKVVSAEVVEGEFAHIRLHTDKGGLVTLSNLLGSAHFGPKPKAEFKKSEKEGLAFGKLFLKGQRVNGGLPANQARAAADLIGKKIKGSIVSGLVLPYKTDKDGNPIYASTEAEARERLVSKDFYKIEVLG